MKYKLMLLTVLILSLSSCLYKDVDTFADYCDHINHESNAQITTWSEDEIKADFVSHYNQLMLTSIARTNLGGVSPEDSVVELLNRKEFIGVTQQGDELHITNKFWISASDSILLFIDVPEEETFNGFTKKFEHLLQNRFELSDKMPEYQRCLFAAIGTFYKKVFIHGNDTDGTYEIVVQKNI